MRPHKDEKAAPVSDANLVTRTAEERILSFSNETPNRSKESVMDKSTNPTPPEGWVPVHDIDGSIMHHEGPEIIFNGLSIFTEFTTEHGVRILDSNGTVIPVEP